MFQTFSVDDQGMLVGIGSTSYKNIKIFSKNEVCACADVQLIRWTSLVTVTLHSQQYMDGKSISQSS